MLEIRQREIHCSVPLTLRISGRLDGVALARLGAELEAVVARRLIEAEAAMDVARDAQPAAPSSPRAAVPVRERFEPGRSVPAEESYEIPFYEAEGRRRPVRLAPTPEPTLAELWRAYEAHRAAGREAAARRALGRLETGWWLRHISATGPGVPRPQPIGGASLYFGGEVGPRHLLDRAEREADAGRHSPATELLRLAFLFVQMQLARAYTARSRELEATTSQAAMFVSRIFSYAEHQNLYGLAREILGFYPRRERAALLRGDTASANAFSALGLNLRDEIVREGYLLAGTLGLALESTRTTTAAGGTAYTVHGAAGESLTVTPLPGTPSPTELGDAPSYNVTMRRMLEAVGGQEEFLTDLYRHPEIRAAFARRPPDMHSLADRLRVWGLLYRIHQRDDPFGPLAALLADMERYLRRFTRHTVYNIPDVGVSYLSREMPRDLLGQAFRDCGVYAFTVAYEVYLTARNARPRLPLSLRLYAFLEHVVLAIFDTGEGSFYLVNNDRIDGSYPGGPSSPEFLRRLAEVYGRTLGRRASVAPAMSLELGTTSDAPGTYRRRAWSRYRALGSMSMQPDPSSPAPTERERVAASYRRYYADQERYEQGMLRLGRHLDALSAALAHLDDTARRTRLDRDLPALTALGIRLALIFETHGREAYRYLATPSRLLVGRRPIYITFIAGDPSASYPPSRLGMALLLHQRLGATLDHRAQTILTWIRSEPNLRADLARYVAAGLPPRF